MKKEVEEDWLELIATRLMSSASKLNNISSETSICTASI